jgi:hypothetical protein
MRKTGEPDPKGPGGSRVPKEVQGRSEGAEETARRAEEDAARAENEGYPLGRPDEDPDGAKRAPPHGPRRPRRRRGARGAGP